MRENNIRLTTVMTRYEAEMIKTLARKENISMSNFIRNVLIEKIQSLKNDTEDTVLSEIRDEITDIKFLISKITKK